MLRDQSVSSKARRAASIARPMSSASASAATPSTSSVAGLIVGKVPALPVDNLPSMNSPLTPSANKAMSRSRYSLVDTCPTCFHRTIASRPPTVQEPISTGLERGPNTVQLPFSATGLPARVHPIAWTCVQRCSGRDHSQAAPARAPRNRRQEETFRKVLAAGIETLREKSYADLTVRAVAARAKVAPATAYTYFSSKNHLIAEVYLDLVRQVPYFTDVNEPMPTRVNKALRHLALVVADEPEVAAACTTALLGGSADPAVRPSATGSARRSTVASHRRSVPTPIRALCRRWR